MLPLTNGRITRKASSWYGSPAHGGDLLDGEARQVFRHIEAAVAGQTGQQHIFEIQGRSLAASTDVAHFANLRFEPETASSKAYGS